MQCISMYKISMAAQKKSTAIASVTLAITVSVHVHKERKF